MEPAEMHNASSKKLLKRVLIIVSAVIVIGIVSSLSCMLIGSEEKSTKPEIPIDYPELTEIKTSEDIALEILYTYPDIQSLVETGFREPEPDSPILTIPDRSNRNEFIFRIFPNSYVIKLNPITTDVLREKCADIEDLSLDFKVDTQKKTVEPYFEEVENYQKVKGTAELLVPGTNVMTVLPKKYDIQIMQGEKVTIVGTDLGKLLNGCSSYMQESWQFCRDLFAQFDQQTLDDIKKENLYVSIRHADTELDQEAWALENINYEGMYLREWVEEYGEGYLGEYVNIGNKTFYKIREGCCGDGSTSYIYKNSNNKLIFFKDISSNQDEFVNLLSSIYEIEK